MKTVQEMETRTRHGGPQPPAHALRRTVWTLFVVFLLLGASLVIAGRLFRPDGGSAVATKGAPALVNETAAPNWDQLVRAHVSFDAWLRLHPNPALTDLLLTRDNPVYSDMRTSLAAMRDGTDRYDPPPGEPRVGAVTVVSASATTATVRVELAWLPEYRVVDTHGGVVAHSPAGPGGTTIWHLVYQNHHWLLDTSEAS